MKITEKQYNELKEKVESLELLLNGGKGSGNFGHAGRPGEVGGSAPSGSSRSVSSENLRAKLKGTDLEDFADDKLLEFYKARLADEKDAKERVKSMGGSKETIDSFDKSIKAYEKDIATLEAEKQKQDEQDIDKKIEEAKQRLYDIQDNIEAETDFGGDTSHLESLEQEAEEELKQLKEQKLAEIRDRNRQKREAEVSKAKAEREEHIKQIDKIIGSEKITEGKTKAEDDKNYKKLEKDVREIKRILAKEKSRENFGQEEIRKLKDKYSDYMSGNWSTVGRFMGLVRDLEDWADNYQNY